MATFVLVHGAWHGAWCWRRVARMLTQAGHEVFTPTLTGVGERSHLLKPDVNLDTHILDVVNEMRWQELNNVVLVGHSYAGMVITGVAEKGRRAIWAGLQWPEHQIFAYDLSVSHGLSTPRSRPSCSMSFPKIGTWVRRSMM